jgi:periplasmic protein TonB
MKRKTDKVPGFDEIIFENRNKEYGAYDLRRRSNSTTTISILGGITLGALLILPFSFNTEPGTASSGPKIFVIETFDPIIPDVIPPEVKPPAELTNAIQNLAPVVSLDTGLINSLMPIAEDLISTTTNGNPNDTMIYIEPIDQVMPVEQPPAVVVQEMPEYPGGITALMEYINDNISYPDEAVRNNIQGRVILRFVVNTNGSVDRIEVLGSVDPSLDTEAVRVVKTLPRFKPGKDKGVPVPVWFSLPVLFRLQNN